MSGGRSRRRSLLLPAGLVIMAGALGALAVVLGTRTATSAIVDLGPTDEAYIANFRDIEADGPIFFRWSSVPSSEIVFPIGACDGGSVRLRVRRHFADPAYLSVFLGGVAIGAVDVRAGVDEPYRVITFPFSIKSCASNARVLLESSVDNGRPLGVAVDWAEIRSTSGFAAGLASVVRGGVLIALLAVGTVAAATPFAYSAPFLLAVSGLLGFGFSATPVGMDRILNAVLPAMLLVGLGAAVLVRLGHLESFSPHARQVVLASIYVALFSRAVFLHPAVFYPDYRVHGLVQTTLHNTGLSSFLDHLFQIQYARGLGLQQIEGRWYPFPYPPGAYLLSELVARIFRLDSLLACQATALAAAALLPLVVTSLGRALNLSDSVSSLGAAFLAMHPLLSRRMALGYFPGVVGQLFDAGAMVLVLSLYDQRHRSRWQSWLALLGSFVASFLVYTQAIANFGLLFLGLVLAGIAFRRDGERRRIVSLGGVLALALGLSFALFYWRYVPLVTDIVRGEPPAESRVLDRLEDLRRGAGTSRNEPEDVNDPYAGDSLNPIRGIGRLASRTWQFHGPFTVTLILGGALMVARALPTSKSLILAWVGVAVWISLAAAGLASPNSFQHLKDLEFVVPLFCLAMGAFSEELSTRWPAAKYFLLTGWLLFALRLLQAELSQRLMPLVRH